MRIPPILICGLPATPVLKMLCMSEPPDVNLVHSVTPAGRLYTASLLFASILTRPPTVERNLQVEWYRDICTSTYGKWLKRLPRTINRAACVLPSQWFRGMVDRESYRPTWPKQASSLRWLNMVSINTSKYKTRAVRPSNLQRSIFQLVRYRTPIIRWMDDEQFRSNVMPRTTKATDDVFREFSSMG